MNATQLYRKLNFDFSKGRQSTKADCPNNTEYRVCSGAAMQPGRQDLAKFQDKFRRAHWTVVYL